jgi:hypothetical protein
MDDIENIVDVISAIEEGDEDVVRKAVELHHVTATAQDQEGAIILLSD